MAKDNGDGGDGDGDGKGGPFELTVEADAGQVYRALIRMTSGALRDGGDPDRLLAMAVSHIIQGQKMLAEGYHTQALTLLAAGSQDLTAAISLAFELHLGDLELIKRTPAGPPAGAEN